MLMLDFGLIRGRAPRFPDGKWRMRAAPLRRRGVEGGLTLLQTAQLLPGNRELGSRGLSGRFDCIDSMRVVVRVERNTATRDGSQSGRNLEKEGGGF
jgi:hypothetical protein